MKHKIKLTKTSQEELAKLDKSVIDKLWLNFIAPIRNGLTPPDEVPGKYKPSWECEFINSPMKMAFVNAAQKRNLYHYHFGYLFYKDGKDPKYPGDVSDGIVHTRIETLAKETSHVILQVCLEHPSPFKYPFERSNEKALDEQDAA